MPNFFGERDKAMIKDLAYELPSSDREIPVSPEFSIDPHDWLEMEQAFDREIEQIGPESSSRLIEDTLRYGAHLALLAPKRMEDFYRKYELAQKCQGILTTKGANLIACASEYAMLFPEARQDMLDYLRTERLNDIDEYMRSITRSIDMQQSMENHQRSILALDHLYWLGLIERYKDMLDERLYKQCDQTLSSVKEMPSFQGLVVPMMALIKILFPEKFQPVEPSYMQAAIELYKKQLSPAGKSVNAIDTAFSIKIVTAQSIEVNDTGIFIKSPLPSTDLSTEDRKSSLPVERRF